MTRTHVLKHHTFYQLPDHGYWVSMWGDESGDNQELMGIPSWPDGSIGLYRSRRNVENYPEDFLDAVRRTPLFSE